MAAFLTVLVYWLLRLRGRYREHPFVTFAIPVALIGALVILLGHGLVPRGRAEARVRTGS